MISYNFQSLTKPLPLYGSLIQSLSSLQASGLDVLAIPSKTILLFKLKWNGSKNLWFNDGYHVQLQAVNKDSFVGLFGWTRSALNHSKNMFHCNVWNQWKLLLVSHWSNLKKSRTVGFAVFCFYRPDNSNASIEFIGE